MWCHILQLKKHYELFLNTPATAVLLSFAFSVHSLLKIYVFAHGFTSQKGGVSLLGSVLLLGSIQYLNYAGYITQITRYVDLKPLFSLNANSIIRENYYAQHWNSTLAGTSEAHGCEIQLQHRNKGI